VWPAQAKLPTAAPAKLVICDETIETIHDQLKNICQIEHTRHRSPLNFLVHLLAGLTAYCHLPKKPSLHLDRDLLALAAATVIQN
jgi:Transposase DDE domain